MKAKDFILLSRYVLGMSLVAYLIGAFAAASFDITDWHIVWRGAIAILGPIVGVTAFVVSEDGT